ncbi:MAG: sugar transferase [Ignavibacteria bacterium]
MLLTMKHGKDSVLFLSEITASGNIKIYLFLKRAFDITFACVLLAICFPVLSIFFIIAFIETGQSPLYAQKRGLTFQNSLFYVFKIRTLRYSDQTGIPLSSEIFIKKDLRPSVTLSGKYLRRSGLDELPQLINIIRGNMSFVGPRPLSLTDLDIMKKEQPKLYYRRSAITSKPGLTGLWQVYRNRDEGIINLIELDEEYEQKKSIALDFKLLLKTIPMVLFANTSDAIMSD